eukprot:9428039-Pyramimonas_sp.AAC.1
MGGPAVPSENYHSGESNLGTRNARARARADVHRAVAFAAEGARGWGRHPWRQLPFGRCGTRRARADVHRVVCFC